MRNLDGMRHTKFTDPIFQLNQEANEFDITYIDNTHLKYHKEHYRDFNSQGEPNIGVYIIKLMVKIAETSQLNRRRFIDYQVSIHKYPIKWLIEVDQLIHANAFQFEENTDERESFYDFKKIILQKAEELESPRANDNLTNPAQKIQSQSYDKFLTLFVYNYLGHPSIMFYYVSIREALDLVKKEILNNLVNLNSEDKRAYFEKLKFEVASFKNDHHDFSADITGFQKKYKIKKFNILEALLVENELYKILSFPKAVKDVDKPTEEEDEILSIRFAFYNYYYYDFLAQFLDFIKTQEDIYFPKQIEGNFASEIFWQKSDTDLLELIASLIESGSINNQTKNLTRKDTIRYFETFLNCQIKDAENKLSKATARKNDKTQFLTTLTRAFIEYCDKKDK